ncbi:MAG: condensation domain-containing protein, partial [Pseudomonadota bacterium]
MSLPDGIEDILPLTPAQAGMLFHVLENPALRGRYVAVVSCHLNGPLDAERLETAMQAAVTARDAYRAAFIWEGVKQPVQAIHNKVTLSFAALDWRDNGPSEQNARLADFVATEQRRAFDLAQAPLMTCHLIALSTDHHVLVWTVHHLISDGWSTSV